MNNEPVAWIEPKELDMDVSTSVTKSKQFESDIPLYTHPVKELTDEEIDDFTVRIYNCRTGAEAHEIVLAILRKAQEKCTK